MSTDLLKGLMSQVLQQKSSKKPSDQSDTRSVITTTAKSILGTTRSLVDLSGDLGKMVLIRSTDPVALQKWLTEAAVTIGPSIFDTLHKTWESKSFKHIDETLLTALEGIAADKDIKEDTLVILRPFIRGLQAEIESRSRRSSKSGRSAAEDTSNQGSNRSTGSSRSHRSRGKSHQKHASGTSVLTASSLRKHEESYERPSR